MLLPQTKDKSSNEKYKIAVCRESGEIWIQRYMDVLRLFRYKSVYDFRLKLFILAAECYTAIGSL